MVFQDIGSVTRGPIAAFNSCIALASSTGTDVKVCPSAAVLVAVVIEAGQGLFRFGSTYGFGSQHHLRNPAAICCVPRSCGQTLC